MQNKDFEERLQSHGKEFARVVPFAEGDKLLRMDFTAANEELTDEIVNDTNAFIRYINGKLKGAGAKYGIGGYGENRTIYRRSKVFNAPSGPIPPFPAGEGHPLHNALPAERPDEDNEEFYWTADVTVYKELKVFVSQHRKNPTEAETLLWQRLRDNRLDGYSFRRQHIIGRFIADFVCLAKKLIVEVDGLQHQLPQNQCDDSDRTYWLKSKGYEVMRFINNEVLFETEKVLKRVSEKLRELPFAEKRLYHKNTASPQSEDLCADPSPGGGSWMGAGRDGATQARTLHLGTDIWGAPYTKVIAPLNGIVHSFAFNNAYGDYGATMILTHNLGGETFHTLYGHLSLNSLKNLHEGDAVYKGDVIAEFGIPFENGQWPPHLHFQIIKDTQGAKGDYPGVCAVSEKEKYLANCPDADLIVRMTKFAVTR